MRGCFTQNAFIKMPSLGQCDFFSLLGAHENFYAVNDFMVMDDLNGVMPRFDGINFASWWVDLGIVDFSNKEQVVADFYLYTIRIILGRAQNFNKTFIFESLSDRLHSFAA